MRLITKMQGKPTLGIARTCISQWIADEIIESEKVPRTPDGIEAQAAWALRVVHYNDVFVRLRRDDSKSITSIK